MKGNRRDFLKLSAASAVALIPAAAEASADRKSADFDDVFGVLVDTAVCVGCRKCEWACDNSNSLSDQPLNSFEDKSVFASRRRPTDQRYTVVNQIEPADNNEKKNYIKLQCMHCNDPACVSACIVGALKKEPEGPVSYDAWKCIGCRYCMVACPFQIPAYEYDNALDPEVRKCTFCLDKLRKGEKPACVAICPNEALTFGKRGDLIKMAHSRIALNPDRYIDHIYGQREVGGTSWMYLAPVDFSRTDLPKLPDKPIPQATEPIQHGIFKGFIPPLALYGLLGLAMYSLRQRKQNGDSDDERH